MNEAVSNTPELSVSELAGALKRTIEDAFGQVRLRGEISGYRGPHSSGHVYFSLKDENAKIDAVIWKGVFSRIKFRPEDGLEVIATGRITTYAGKSSYQLIIEQMEPAGIGALMALLEERRRRLQTEGLFDPIRKRKLPYLPHVVGIVTSPTGAVIRDMIHRLSDRFPREVLLWPVRVQGEGSAAEVAAAIAGFNAIGPEDELPRPDVLIVARGGGSLEDLWSFNEEIVIRAAAASDIPLVAAIGHETDWTLLDLVADVRAPTPTAAAELVVPVRIELIADTRERAARLAGAVLRLQERRRRDFVNLVRTLPSADRALEAPRQRLDHAVLRGQSRFRSALDRRKLSLGSLARYLAAQSPEARLARFREKLYGLGARLPGLMGRYRQDARRGFDQTTQRLARALGGRLQLERNDRTRRAEAFGALERRLKPAVAIGLDRREQRLAALDQLLRSLGYKQVLARGYAVLRDGAGKVIRQAGAVANGQRLAIELSDGRIEAIATESRIHDRPASRSGRPKTPAEDQGSLF